MTTKPAILAALEIDRCFTVSTGTLRDDDLVAAFVPVLRALAANHWLFERAKYLAPQTNDSEDFDTRANELIDALADHAPDGFYFGAHEGDGTCFGFWETEERAAEREWVAFEQELSDIHAGELPSLRDTRKVHLCGEAPADRFQVFAFGAYGSTYVAVGFEPVRGHAACVHGMASGRDFDDALEVAAETLLEVAPGSFTEPDYQKACNDVGVSFADSQAEVSNEDYAEILTRAEADLTYTESGWLISHEWTIVGVKTREELLAFARGE